jgi:hypothetical protein
VRFRLLPRRFCPACLRPNLLHQPDRAFHEADRLTAAHQPLPSALELGGRDADSLLGTLEFAQSTIPFTLCVVELVLLPSAPFTVGVGAAASKVELGRPYPLVGRPEPVAGRALRMLRIGELRLSHADPGRGPLPLCTPVSVPLGDVTLGRRNDPAENRESSAEFINSTHGAFDNSAQVPDLLSEIGQRVLGRAQLLFERVGPIVDTALLPPGHPEGLSSTTVRGGQLPGEPAQVRSVA